MGQLNFPPYSFKTKVINDKKYIFDRIRKKYVILQPEEIVRQNMVEFLINEKEYPASLIANETSISYNSLQKRCDTIIYKKDGTPLMIIEYKAPNITIDQSTFDQIAVYNLKLRVNYLLVSNGVQHYCCKVDLNTNEVVFLKGIPTYKEMEN